MTEQPINRESEVDSEVIAHNHQISMRNQVEPLLQHGAEPTQKIRIKSLDIYRGLTMCGMILVDNMGPVNDPPWFLDHAEWHGLTPADLIFPAFLFIMGMAVPLAVSPRRPFQIRNIIRIAGLFLIGFALNLIGKKFDFEVVRVLGILQRLSICYAAILLFHVITKYGEEYRRRIGSLFMFGLFAVYLSLMVSFNGGEDAGPGCNKQNNLTDLCNYAGYIDRVILTPAHMLKHVYTDPEGIISTIGAILTTYMGYYYSLIMGRHKHEPKKLLTIWITISVIAGALVYPVTLIMPLNKKIYSSSFTLIVVAISGASLTFFYALVDLLPTYKPNLKKIVETITSPLLWLGLNPLAIFVLMDLVAIFMILYIKIDNVSMWTQFYRHVFSSWIDNHQVAATLFACFFLLLWTIVAGIMHRFKLYVRL